MGEIFQDRDAVLEAYNDVRKDDSPTNWFVYYCIFPHYKHLQSLLIQQEITTLILTFYYSLFNPRLVME